MSNESSKRAGDDDVLFISIGLKKWRRRRRYNLWKLICMLYAQDLRSLSLSLSPLTNWHNNWGDVCVRAIERVRAPPTRLAWKRRSHKKIHASFHGGHFFLCRYALSLLFSLAAKNSQAREKKTGEIKCEKKKIRTRISLFFFAKLKICPHFPEWIQRCIWKRWLFS